MTKQYTAYYRSEIGTIEIVGTEQGIISVGFMEEPGRVMPDFHKCLEPCIHQLDDYFHGKLKIFTLPLLIRGTSFQKKVWNALIEIPYGATQSYAEMARKIGHRNAYRAVGNANNQNNIAIIIPCHRVIGSNGRLTGYAGGIWRKEWLLAHERNFRTTSLFSE
jgi:methylated-DNA-[protein]-cysteine S-methyltransferase